MRFADELLGSEGEHCTVKRHVEGCDYAMKGIIRAVHDGGQKVTVQFEGGASSINSACEVIRYTDIELVVEENVATLVKQIESGEPFKVTAHGVEADVVMLDKVFPDRTVGQHEAGWWVCLTELANDDDRADSDEWFLSASGCLYGATARPSKHAGATGYYVWEETIGSQPQLQSEATAADQDEAFACHIDESAGLAGER